MSSKRRTVNNQFRNPKIREPFTLDKFLDLLVRSFPNRDFSSKHDFQWADRFHRATNEAFSTAVMWEVLKKRPPDHLLAQRLAEISNAASKLAELITGSQLNDGLISSNRIWYWMTHAIGRNPDDLERFVRTIPEIAHAAQLGSEAIEDDVRKAQKRTSKKSPTKAECPTVIGRPTGSGDIFKNRFLKEMELVWKNFVTESPITLVTRPDAEVVCPFCSFMEMYFRESGIGFDDTAQAIAARMLGQRELHR
jgi:hypothetical protein